MKRKLIAVLLLIVMLVTSLPIYMIPVTAAETEPVEIYSNDFSSESKLADGVDWDKSTSVATYYNGKMKIYDKGDGSKVAWYRNIDLTGINAETIVISMRLWISGKKQSNLLFIGGKSIVTTPNTDNAVSMGGKTATITYTTSGEGLLFTMEIDTSTGAATATLSESGTVKLTATYEYDPAAIADSIKVQFGKVRYCTRYADDLYVGYIPASSSEPEAPEATKYTVTAVADGATVDTAEVEEGASYTLPAAPAKEGYTFVNWTDGTNTYNTGDSVVINANTTFTAVYELDVVAPTTYQVTVTVDGATVASAEVEEGASYALPAAPAKDGYTFKGWSDGVTTYEAGAQVTIVGDTAFAAIFEENAPSGGEGEEGGEEEEPKEELYFNDFSTTAKLNEGTAGTGASIDDGMLFLSSGADGSTWQKEIDVTGARNDTIIVKMRVVSTSAKASTTFIRLNGVNIVGTTTNSSSVPQITFGGTTYTVSSHGKSTSGGYLFVATIKKSTGTAEVKLYDNGSYDDANLVGGKAITVELGAIGDTLLVQFGHVRYSKQYIDDLYVGTVLTTEPVVPTYTVNAVAEGATVDTKTVNEGESYTLPTAPAKEGYNFIGWTDGATTYEAGASVVITGDTTFTAQYELINITKYTVTVVSDGNTIATEEISEGATYTLPEAQTKEGFNFTGWTDGVSTYEAGAKVSVTGDVTFTATFVAKVYYNVTVVSDGDTIVNTSVEENTTYALPAAISKEGYNFIGWTDGATTFAAGTEITVTGSVTFTAVFEAKVYFTVTVVSDGAAIATVAVEEGQSYTLPAAPEKDGYNFVGFSDGANVYGAGASITVVGDTTLTAVFEEKSPVTMAGNFIVKNYSEEILVADPYKGYAAANKIDKNTNKSAPVLATITRTTSNTRNVAKLTFDSVGTNKGTGISFYIPEGELTSEQVKYVSIQYRYNYKDDTFNNKGAKMTLGVAMEAGGTTYIQSSNTMVAGEWATVTFDISSITTAGDIKHFYLYPYTFNGTNYGMTHTDTAKKQVNFVAGDTVELGAFFFSSDADNKYKKTTTFTFYNNSFKEEVVNTVSSVEGVITIPAAEEKEGYTFKGWVDDEGNTYVVGSTVYTYTDTEIYANYRPNDAQDNEFRVAFNNNGGEGEEIEPYYASTVTMPAAPVKLGYTFTGWTDGDSVYQVGETATITKDTVFTATYIETYYTVTIMVDGELYKEAIIREGAKYKLPAPAQKPGYTFICWSDGTNVFSSGVEVMVIGDITLEAVFVEGTDDRDIDLTTYRSDNNSFRIRFDENGNGTASAGGFLGITTFNQNLFSAFTANGKSGGKLTKSSSGNSNVFILNSFKSPEYPSKSLISFDIYFNELPAYEDGKVGILTDRGHHKSGLAYSVETSWLQIWTDENGDSWAGMESSGTPMKVTSDQWYSFLFYIPGTTSNQANESISGYMKAENDHTYRAIGTLKGCSMVGSTNQSLIALYNNPYMTFTLADFSASTYADDTLIKLSSIQHSYISNGVYGVRFIASLGGLATGQTEIGFDIACPTQGREWTVTTDTVYKSVTANYGIDTVSAEAMGGEYLSTVTIGSIPASYGELTFECTPYVVWNGVKIYGTKVTIVVLPDSGNIEFSVLEGTGETTLPMTVHGAGVDLEIVKDGVSSVQTYPAGEYVLTLSNDTEEASHTYELNVRGAGWCTYGDVQTQGRIVKKDAIIVEFGAREEGKHESFIIYIPASDPSGRYYIGYNIEYQSVTNVASGNAAANSNLYRVYGASLYYVSYWDGVTLKATNKLEVLQEGEISLALLEYYDGDYANKAEDYIGGLHGDERLLDPDNAKLYLDGVEYDLTAASGRKFVACSYITFTQETTMYRCGTATTDSYGTAVATHNQYFRIDESGFRNDQSITWLVDDFHVRENFMQMFTMKRLDGYWSAASGSQTYYYTDPVCESFRVYDGSGNVLHEQTMLTNGNYQDRQQVCVNTKNRKIDYWSSVSGVSAYAGFTLPYDNVYVNNAYVFLREDYSKGDNKWYVSIKSRSTGDNPDIGEVWCISNYYGIDYDSRTIVK